LGAKPPMRRCIPCLLALAALLGFVGPAARAEPPEPLAKLHVLIVLDTNDATIGDTLDIDKKRIISLLKRQLPTNRLAITTLEGKQASRANITAYYKALTAGPDQGTVLYYGGHGGATKEGQHFFVLSADRYERFWRDDVRKLMEGT